MSDRPCGDPLGRCLCTGPHPGKPHAVPPGDSAAGHVSVYQCSDCDYAMWDASPMDVDAHWRTAHRDVALARSERAEAQVVTLRKAAQEVVDELDIITRHPHTNLRVHSLTRQGLVVALSDTEAAATATVERIQQEATAAERERWQNAIAVVRRRSPFVLYPDLPR